MPPADDEVEQRLRAALAGRRHVRLALLFGSRARGDHRPDSDVDVAVVAADVDPAACPAELSSAVGLEVDVAATDRVADLVALSPQVPRWVFVAQGCGCVTLGSCPCVLG